LLRRQWRGLLLLLPSIRGGKAPFKKTENTPSLSRVRQKKPQKKKKKPKKKQQTTKTPEEVEMRYKYRQKKDLRSLSRGKRKRGRKRESKKLRREKRHREKKKVWGGTRPRKGSVKGLSLGTRTGRSRSRTSDISFQRAPRGEGGGSDVNRCSPLAQGRKD